MNYKEALKNKEQILNFYQFNFFMLNSQVFKLIQKEVKPMEIIDNCIVGFLLPREFKDLKNYAKNPNKIMVRCDFRYKDPFKKYVLLGGIQGLKLREPKVEWKDCNEIVFEFSPEFYEKVSIKERIDEEGKVVDYFLELKEAVGTIDFRANQVMKELKDFTFVSDFEWTEETDKIILGEIEKRCKVLSNKE